MPATIEPTRSPKRVTRLLAIRAAQLTLMLVCLTSCAVLTVGERSDPAEPLSATQLVNRMITALGGADRWAGARYVHTKAVNHHPDARLPYIQEGWIDLRQMRHRIELTNYDMQRVRAYDADRGWGIAEGDAYAFSAERLKLAHDTYRQLIYRKIHLFVTGAKGLRLNRLDDGRVAFALNGEPLGWIEIDPVSGAPRAAGVGEDITQFGPLERFGDIYWFGSGTSTSGWGFETLAFELLDDSAQIAFEAPP